MFYEALLIKCKKQIELFLNQEKLLELTEYLIWVIFINYK